MNCPGGDTCLVCDRAAKRAPSVDVNDISTPNGFRGVRGRVITESWDESGFHFIRVVEYSFPGSDGSVVRYIEAGEANCHSSVPTRLLSFSAAVHVLQNVGAEEVWSIGNREPE